MNLRTSNKHVLYGFVAILFHFVSSCGFVSLSFFFLSKRKINFKHLIATVVESMWGQTRWGRTHHEAKPAATIQSTLHLQPSHLT